MAAHALPILGFTPTTKRQFLSTQHSSSIFERNLTGGQHLTSFSYTTRGNAFRMLPNPNASSTKGNSFKEVNMVDPLEAKKLAAKQMQEIKAKEKMQRRRKIEAINGAWAMLGLTAGLIIEGHTGKSIVDQLVGYFQAIASLFVR